MELFVDLKAETVEQEVALEKENIIVGGSGTIDIFENGPKNVKPYEFANVQVPLPHGEVELTSNGPADVKDFETALVNVQPTLIEKTVTENKTYNASDDNADGYSSVSVDVADRMDMYITKTLERLRLNNVPSGSLSLIVPGRNYSKNTIIKSVELPNNTDDIGIWQFANMTYLELFDAGYTHLFDNVCLLYNINLKALIIRTSDTLPALYNTNAIGFHSTGKIYVPKNLIEDYKTATVWSYWSARYQELYIAETIAEKEQMLISSDIPNGSMIVCDVDETYTVKGA